MKEGSSFNLKIAGLGAMCALFLLAAAAAASPLKKGAIEITRVALDEKSFNPSKGETATLGF